MNIILKGGYMVLKKTARLNMICGNCEYYNGNNKICSHPDMKKKKINSPDTPCLCGCKYFQSRDDYESAGR